MFRAVVGMSVPFAPPGKVDLLSALEKMGITNFYMQYFQAPGVAEAELNATWRPPSAASTSAAQGDAPPGATFGMLSPRVPASWATPSTPRPCRRG